MAHGYLLWLSPRPPRNLPTSSTFVTTLDSNLFQPGDIVAVRHGVKGRQEGLVIGSHIDYAVRVFPSEASSFTSILNVALLLRADKSSKSSWIARFIMHGGCYFLHFYSLYHSIIIHLIACSRPPIVLCRYPTVTRVRRTISYSRPSLDRRRTIERRVYW